MTKGKPVVIIEDEAKVPVVFKKVLTPLDKTALLKALKAGHDIPGCKLGESEQALRIR